MDTTSKLSILEFQTASDENFAKQEFITIFNEGIINVKAIII